MFGHCAYQMEFYSKALNAHCAIVLRVWYFIRAVAFYRCSVGFVVVGAVVAAAVIVDFHRIGLIRHLSLNTNHLLTVFFLFVVWNPLMCVGCDLYFFIIYFFLASHCRLHCVRSLYIGSYKKRSKSTIMYLDWMYLHLPKAFIFTRSHEIALKLWFMRTFYDIDNTFVCIFFECFRSLLLSNERFLIKFKCIAQPNDLKLAYLTLVGLVLCTFYCFNIRSIVL